jgi:DNA-binding transcriptional MocR family regulator
MDVAGRVIRADTFSKFLAPVRFQASPACEHAKTALSVHFSSLFFFHAASQGLRVGWLTAPPAVTERLLRCLQASAQGANSHAQILAARLLAAWGTPGLHAHACTLQAEYARRAAALMAAAQKHLGGSGGDGGAPGAPLATWAPPRAGMFLWTRLGCGVEDAEALQPFLKEFKARARTLTRTHRNTSQKHRKMSCFLFCSPLTLSAHRNALALLPPCRLQVVVVPGSFFHVDGARSPFVRLSFASASDDDFDAGMARLAQLLRSLPGAAAAPHTPPAAAAVALAPAERAEAGIAAAVPGAAACKAAPGGGSGA